MIHAIKSICQITTNSLTCIFWLIDLNTLSVSQQAESSVITFLKLYCFVTSILFVCRYLVNLRRTAFVLHIDSLFYIIYTTDEHGTNDVKLPEARIGPST